MAEPYLGEIRIVSFGFEPDGWAFCDGRLLSISANLALFSILGTTYGGNGMNDFALPDLRNGRTAIHVGNGHVLGESGGEEQHTLVADEMPTHTHPLQAASASGTTTMASGNVLAATRARLYGDARGLTALAPSTISSIGSSQPHENQQPLLALTFIIAIEGILPSQV